MTYDTYEPSVAAGPAEAEGQAERDGSQGPWRVLVEYSNRGDLKPPTVV